MRRSASNQSMRFALARLWQFANSYARSREKKRCIRCVWRTCRNRLHFHTRTCMRNGAKAVFHSTVRRFARIIEPTEVSMKNNSFRRRSFIDFSSAWQKPPPTAVCGLLRFKHLWSPNASIAIAFDFIIKRPSLSPTPPDEFGDDGAMHWCCHCSCFCCWCSCSDAAPLRIEHRQRRMLFPQTGHVPTNEDGTSAERMASRIFSCGD